ncbi:hypothetical protein Poli38472_014672 [Pythium oligandrum]|uniref:Uncharacterized protein n=1 Tax=Pythium oligandrum TaxID=41045 RepID=A0A8K1CIE1_PYTOL|nr:hypothetical protein Poli38472_014672 [Pythium oligandrum]|eukprot:TMW63967.1 hypothetical protein Poli38472_014672 [Pythium oligandrum]
MSETLHPRPLKLDYMLEKSPSKTHKSEYASNAYLNGPAQEDDPTVRGRFVAGEAFFNYGAMGGLREGLPVVELLSISHGGLLVNAVVMGFVNMFFQYTFQVLMLADYSSAQEAQSNAAKYLLQWPGAFSVFFGLISDCFPLFGLRRKSYMVLGWVIACVMFVAMVIVCHATHPADVTRGYLLLMFSIFAAFGLQIAYISAFAMTIELAQREHLYQRGHLQALYLVWYSAFATLAQIVTTLIIKRDDFGTSMTSSIDMIEAAAILAGMCVVPIPFLLYCLQEDHADGQRVTFGRRVVELWQLLRWKVVYRVLFFLCISLFVSAAYDSNVATALAFWSGLTAKTAGWITVSQFIARFLGVFLFKTFFVNYSWRRLAILGLVSNVVAKAILGGPTIYAAVRNQWYMCIWTLVSDIYLGVFDIFALVIPTEIADIGREGAVIGLVNSFTVLISIATYTLWASVSEAVGASVDIVAILVDLDDTRQQIMIVGVVYLVVNLLAVGASFFVPNQKLDAQQLRAFGGYNNLGRVLIVAAFVVLVIYCLVANVLKIVENE